LKPFHELTHRGQARRLRPHAARLLDSFGISPARLRQLTAATNVVFRVDCADGRRLVLRMTSPKSAHSAENVRSEIAWIRALARESEIGVPEPIPAPDGEYVRTLQAPDIPGAWHCALFMWVPGAMLDERLTLENVSRHGRLAATLHEHGRTFAPPEGFRIRRYRSLFPYADPSVPNPEPIVLFDRCPPELMPPARLAVFREAHDRIQAEIDRLFEEAPPQVIHNDLHAWNVKVCRRRLYALDFEDLLLGHPAQDLATTLYYYHYRENYEGILDAFRAGYETVRAWPEQRAGQLEALIAGRGILLANFVVASPDAEERAIAPEYLRRIEERLRAFLAGQ